MANSEFWQIFLYPVGWFYLTLHDLDFIPVHGGDDTEVLINIQQQVQIPIEGIFKYTVPETTLDCEANENFSFDHNLTETLHNRFNATNSCTFPFLGGIDSPANFSMCTDPALYDTELGGNTFS